MRKRSWWLYANIIKQPRNWRRPLIKVTFNKILDMTQVDLGVDEDFKKRNLHVQIHKLQKNISET